MRLSELEDIIRASGQIAEDDEIIIIGSQAILGQFPNAPLRFLTSMEADIFPNNKPELAEKVDGAIGEGSSFHELHGYYAQGVGQETAVLPDRWRERLVSIKNDNTNGITGLCLDVHDLAISKLVAGRPKDLEFLQELIRHRMIDLSTLFERLADTGIQDSERDRIRARIRALSGRGESD